MRHLKSSLNHYFACRRSRFLFFLVGSFSVVFGGCVLRRMCRVVFWCVVGASGGRGGVNTVGR